MNEMLEHCYPGYSSRLRLVYMQCQIDGIDDQIAECQIDGIDAKRRIEKMQVAKWELQDMLVEAKINYEDYGFALADCEMELVYSLGIPLVYRGAVEKINWQREGF